MAFLVRGVEEKDLAALKSLAEQFSLLNMPPDAQVLSSKVSRSVKSFAGKLKKEDAEYIFVIEDTETQKIVGSSLILAKHGTTKIPHNYFKVLKKERFSKDLGIGFIHTILRFAQNTDGPTEIGGLLIDRHYRRRPEKLGKVISLIRFIYMGLNPEKFQEQILCELTPPLTKDGRSEFWEALGRRFTGLPYPEADKLSQINKEFIRNLFPEEDIYLTLLDSKARFVLGRVGEATMPAKHLLESIGFQYIDEVDPFDGGPHYGVRMADVSVIKSGHKSKVALIKKQTLGEICLLGTSKSGHFRGTQSSYSFEGGELYLPKVTLDLLGLEPGEEVFWATINEVKS